MFLAGEKKSGYSSSLLFKSKWLKPDGNKGEAGLKKNHPFFHLDERLPGLRAWLRMSMP